MLLGFALGHSQSNNPQNKVGADILAAAAVVGKDFKDGKLQNVDQATIDRYYATLLPGYQPVKLAEFTKIAQAMKGANSYSVIDGSGFSDKGKGFLRKSLTDYSQTALADDVKKSNISETEKTQILTVIAINYNMVKPTPVKPMPAGKSKGPNGYFDVDFNDAELAQSPQAGIWSAVGVVLGFSICGPWCAIIGGILGAMVGSTPGTTTVTGPNGSHTYTSGGPKP